MYLLDTNIFLEVLLNQEQCSVAKYILNRGDFNLFISDFSLYSIGIFLVRRKDFTAMSEFLNDIENRGVTITRLNTEDIYQVANFCSQFNLDFDDGYQYYTTEKII